MTKRFILLCIGFIAFATFVDAQSASKIEEFKARILEDEKFQALSKEDLNDLKIIKEYTDIKTGITHVYFQQYLDGLPVYNALGSMHMKNNKMAAITSTFIDDLDGKLPTSNQNIDHNEAINKVANYLNIDNITFTPVNDRNNKNQYVFNDVSFTDKEVTVNACYVLNANQQLSKVWSVDTDMKSNPDYWSTRVDMSTGDIVDQFNYTIYCKHDIPDKISLQQHLRTHEQEQSGVREGERTYKVYQLPAESPIHGPHTLVSDPSNIEASPLGWHDVDGIEGADYTITRGNNVHAYLDKDDDNISDGGEPDGGEELIFIFDHALNGNPAFNDEAAQVNLFYMNNMMHDISNLLGFDEAAGNFQYLNYSEEGFGGDAVEAQGSDGSGLDNANFSTPPDGTSGRMQMFLC